MQVLSIARKKRIHSIAFSPDGRELAAACGDGQLRLWDLTTGKVRQAVPIEETSCGYDLTYLGPGRLLFAGTQLRWWDIPADEWHVIVASMGWARQVRVSPDGQTLALVDRASSTDWGGFGLALHETAAWTRLPAPEEAAFTTGGVAFSADNRRLATGHIVRVGEKRRYLRYAPGGFPVPDYDYVVHVRELPSGRVVHSAPGWQQGVGNLAFSADGRTLVGTAGPRLRVWDLEGGREVALHKRGTRHFQGLSFTSDGRYLAAVSNDTTVRVWDTFSWQEHTTFQWEVGRLLNIAFAPDGFRAAAGSDSGKVVIWDVED